MKIKLSDYVANFLVEHSINHVFSLTGGGAMHLNDSLGHKEGLTVIYNHHEQACAIAAESYARINNKIAAVCVTTGPGGTNAMTGVVGGFLDSIPMLIISGQVRYDTTARSTGLNIRAVGDQEFDITLAAKAMTKYAEMITDPLKIKYCLEKAYYLATTGRPGPCWIDIPLNFQSAIIETDELISFDSNEIEDKVNSIPDDTISFLINKISQAERPVLYAGNGIRLSGGYEIFKKVIEKINIPVVTGWDSIDLMYDSHPLYVGRGGMMGDRAGNFAVQNSDFVLSIGNRLSIRQVGYNWETWARDAYVIMNDIDINEIKKPTLHVDYPVCGDAFELLEKLDKKLDDFVLFDKKSWLETCSNWKKKYPVVMNKHYSNDGLVNVYALIKEIGLKTKNKQITVVGNGSACVVGSHAYVIKKDARFIINSAIASMGYDLPASIGACISLYGDKVLYGKGTKLENIILITGDGGIQLNIQELQTIIHHKLPIKIFIINNQGYHSIRLTQTNIFNKNFVGIGPESKDLSFPSMKKIAEAYGYPYIKCTKNKDLKNKISDFLFIEGPAIFEAFVTTDQPFEPKSATIRRSDGSLFSPPLEDLAPFLDREELKKNMFIEPIL